MDFMTKNNNGFLLILDLIMFWFPEFSAQSILVLMFQIAKF